MNIALVIINVSTFLIYVGLASFANSCLVGRDDGNIQLAIMQATARRNERHRDSRNKRRGLLSQSCNNSPSMTSLHTLSTPVSPSSRSATSIRDDDTLSVTSESRDGNDEFTQPESACGFLECRSMIGADVRCWFFILVIVSSFFEAAVNLILLIQSRQQELELRGQRNLQDLIVTPAILFVYMTFASLLMILVHLVEKDVGDVEAHGGQRIMTQRVAAVVLTSVMVVIMPFFFLVMFNVWGDALEAYSTGMEFAIFSAYTFASFKLPKRVLSFGQGLHDVASKIRNVCTAVALCMLVRGTLIMPPVQTAMGNLGDYALPILECSTTIPLLLSLLLLHQPTK